MQQNWLQVRHLSLWNYWLSSHFHFQDFVVLVLTVASSYRGLMKAKSAGVRTILWSVILKDGMSVILNKLNLFWNFCTLKVLFISFWFSQRIWFLLFSSWYVSRFCLFILYLFKTRIGYGRKFPVLGRNIIKARYSHRRQEDLKPILSAFTVMWVKSDKHNCWLVLTEKNS